MITIDYMVVADAATAAEGKHYIHGAGWDTIFAQQFPAVHSSIAVAFLLRVPWNDTNSPCRVEVDLLDADDRSILPNPPGPLGGPITVGRPPNVTPGNDLLAPFVFNLAGTTFNGPGDYVIVMRREGEVVKRYPIHLVSMATVRS
jgi:hypothetical protein